MTKFTNDLVHKFKDAFAKGLNTKEACNHIGLSSSAYYKKTSENPELKDIFEASKSNLSIKAKTNIARDIEAGDTRLSERYLAKKQPEREAVAEEGVRHGESVGGFPEDQALSDEYNAKLRTNILKRSRERAIADGELKE